MRRGGRWWWCQWRRAKRCLRPRQMSEAACASLNSQRLTNAAWLISCPAISGAPCSLPFPRRMIAPDAPLPFRPPHGGGDPGADRGRGVGVVVEVGLADGEGIEPSSVRRRGFQDRLCTLHATIRIDWRQGWGSNPRSLTALRLSKPLHYRSATLSGVSYSIGGRMRLRLSCSIGATVSPRSQCKNPAASP